MAKTPKEVPEARTPASAVDRFLAEARSAGPPVPGRTQRLIFAMDATASRAPTWDLACSLHAELFGAARDSGNLAVQLVYFRGLADFHHSTWSATPDALLQTMLGVRCLGGRTQIVRVIEHAEREAAGTPVRALVLVGDSFEEDPSAATAAAGRLALYGLRMFLFQEGSDPTAARVFASLARITGGAHVPFRAGSADELRELLRAVATYAAQGRAGLERTLASPLSDRLLQQLDR